jgi:DNA-binding response OmpR family regulator
MKKPDTELQEARRGAEKLAEDGYYMPPHEADPCAERRSILVVDDEALIGKAVTSVLSAEGYEVEWLEDGRQTLEKIRAMPCLVLLLLDVRMPHVSGFDILRRIRSQESGRHLPVVMLTAHADPEYVAEGLRSGADGYILKPFKPASLLRSLHDALNAR